MQPILKQTRAAICLFVLLCATTSLVTAQSTTKLSKIYFQAGAGMGSYQSADFDLGIKAILNNKLSLGLSYKGANMTPKNEPADYIPESGIAVIIPYTNYVTTDMSFLTFAVGRSFKISRSVWATTEGGISYVKGDKVTYTPQSVDVSGVFPIVLGTSSNYATFKESKSSAGLALQADINWAFASFMGLGLGVYTNLNSIQSPVGFNLKLILGKMGRDKKPAPVSQ
jgi:hypothetical protein